MTWKHTSATTIQHEDGHVIHLLAGSWEEPMEIRPQFVGKDTVALQSKLMREGLRFAAKESHRQPSKPKSKSFTFPKKDRPVLSLNKR